MTGIATGTARTLQMDISTIAGGPYTRLELYRAREVTGPFEEITAPSEAPAQLRVPARQALVSGKELKLRVNEGYDLSIIFSGVDPISPANVAAQIAAQGLNLVTSRIEGEDLVIETFGVGTLHTLRVLSSDAAVLIGLATDEPDSVAIGKEARLPLLPRNRQLLYSLIDCQSSDSYFYKFRLTDDTLVSDYSRVFTPVDVQNLFPDTVLCHMTLATMEGKPLRDAEIRVRVVGMAVTGSVLIGNTMLVLKTDLNGYASFRGLAGMTYTVLVSGTAIARTFDVPSGVTSFDVFAPGGGVDDLFGVQRPDVDYAVKRSL